MSAGNDLSQQAVQLFDQYASVYAEKYMDVSRYGDTLDCFCESIKSKNASILDTACGPGNITQYLQHKHPEYRIHGIDLSERMIELAKTYNPTATFEVMDLLSISTLPQTFDGAICGFGLPYLSRSATRRFIHAVAERLSPGGVFYLSTMEGDYSQSRRVLPSSGEGNGVFTYFHQAEDLAGMLKEAGFQVLEIFRQENISGGEEVVDLVMVAKHMSKGLRK